MGLWHRADNGNDADDPPPHFANHLAIDFSLSEVELRFGQHAGLKQPIAVQSLIVSSPADLVLFGHAIRTTIALYESRFGRIPDASEPGPGDTRQ